MSNLVKLKNRLIQRLSVGKQVVQQYEQSSTRTSTGSSREHTLISSLNYCPALTFSGISQVTLIGKLQSLRQVLLKNAENHEKQALMLQVATFSYSTDNKYVSLPALSKDVHTVLMYGYQPEKYFLNAYTSRKKLDLKFIPLINSSLASNNTSVRVKGWIGLHSSYEAKYKKKIASPIVHVRLPYNNLSVIG